jgi:hypothetical protein
MSKTHENALELLPHLVKYAMDCELVTYEDLMAKIDMYAINASIILEYIRDEICIPNELPLLTAIVINKTTGLPGDNWLPEGTTLLREVEYKEKFYLHRNKVFGYDGWNNLLKKLNLNPLVHSDEDLHFMARKYKEYLDQKEFSREEIEEIERLKDYISSNPNVINLSPIGPAEIDKDFVTEKSRAIIFPLDGNELALVLVKNGQHPGELVRGLYELVKYNALLRAEIGQGKYIAISNYLVAYEISSEIRKLAAKFYINCYPVALEE